MTNRGHIWAGWAGNHIIRDSIRNQQLSDSRRRIIDTAHSGGYRYRGH